MPFVVSASPISEWMRAGEPDDANRQYAVTDESDFDALFAAVRRGIRDADPADVAPRDWQRPTPGGRPADGALGMRALSLAQTVRSAAGRLTLRCVAHQPAIDSR
jgi:hypothetical protein